MNQSLARVRLSEKKRQLLVSIPKPDSLTAKIIDYVAINPQQTSTEIKAATGCKSFQGIVHGTVNPTLKKHGYKMAYEVTPGGEMPLWSIFKVKED